jgi:hypothetical protein
MRRSGLERRSRPDAPGGDMVVGKAAAIGWPTPSTGDVVRVGIGSGQRWVWQGTRSGWRAGLVDAARYGTCPRVVAEHAWGRARHHFNFPLWGGPIGLSRNKKPGDSPGFLSRELKRVQSSQPPPPLRVRPTTLD